MDLLYKIHKNCLFLFDLADMKTPYSFTMKSRWLNNAVTLGIIYHVAKRQLGLEWR